MTGPDGDGSNPPRSSTLAPVAAIFLRDVALAPCRAAASRDNGTARVACDGRHSLGLCDPIIVWLNPAPHRLLNRLRPRRCRLRAQHSLPGGSLRLARARPSPAGSSWLRSAHADLCGNQHTGPRREQLGGCAFSLRVRIAWTAPAVSRTKAGPTHLLGPSCFGTS